MIWLTAIYEEIMGVTVQPASPEQHFLGHPGEHREHGNQSGRRGRPAGPAGADVLHAGQRQPVHRVLLRHGGPGRDGRVERDVEAGEVLMNDMWEFSVPPAQLSCLINKSDADK